MTTFSVYSRSGKRLAYEDPPQEQAPAVYRSRPGFWKAYLRGWSWAILLDTRDEAPTTDRLDRLARNRYPSQVNYRAAFRQGLEAGIQARLDRRDL